MNLVGKILIVAILFMSLLFMAFALALYTTHRNWKEAVQNDLAPQLKDELAENKKLTAESDKLKQQFEANGRPSSRRSPSWRKSCRRDARSWPSLTPRRRIWRRRRRGRGRHECVASVDGRIAQGVGLPACRQRDFRKDREARFEEVVRLTDLLNQAANERDLLKKRTDELAKDLAKANRLLQTFNTR